MSRVDEETLSSLLGAAERNVNLHPHSVAEVCRDLRDARDLLAAFVRCVRFDSNGKPYDMHGDVWPLFKEARALLESTTKRGIHHFDSPRSAEELNAHMAKCEGC